MTILLTTNHKVDDVVYVASDCVRRGIVKQVDFTQQDVSETPFILLYGILYDGFSFNTNVPSSVNFNETGLMPTVGSPAVVIGSPARIGSPEVGSPTTNAFGSPLPLSLTVIEKTNGGGIYTNKTAALAAFGDTLA